MRRRAFAVVSTLALAAACTHDFDAFDVGHGASSTDGSSNGGAGAADAASGSGGATGTSGAGSGGSSGGASGASGGGTAGQAGAGTGGAFVDGGAGRGGADSGAAAGGAFNAGGAVNAGGAADAGLTCSGTQKRCGPSCVASDAPATGCGAVSCAPCALANTSTAQCTSGACAPLTCVNGFGDCNATASDGCEHSVSDDPLKCGSCARACAGDHVESRACTGGRCTSSCDPGRANCNRPTAVTGNDDGCEVDATTDAQNCGSCGNDCTQQSGKACVASVCRCTQDTECRSMQSAGTTCNTGTGLCSCNGTVCTHGESCRNGNCSCNTGPACTGAQTCCRSPQGCRDLNTDPGSCGACGRACAPGFTCVAGGCQCDADGDCNAGTPGTCATGLCHCGVTTCATGERCLPNGQCG